MLLESPHEVQQQFQPGVNQPAKKVNLGNSSKGSPERCRLVTESTLLAPSAYYSFEPNTAWGIGLGKGDSATNLAADGTTVIDTITWPAGTHATPSFGRCADGTGPFVINTRATRDAANDCPNPYATIVINELRSNDSAGGKDFVELTNTGNHAIDISALTFVDNDPAHDPGEHGTRCRTVLAR